MRAELGKGEAEVERRRRRLDRCVGLMSLQLGVGVAHNLLGLSTIMLKADSAGRPHDSKTVRKEGIKYSLLTRATVSLYTLSSREADRRMRHSFH